MAAAADALAPLRSRKVAKKDDDTASHDWTSKKLVWIPDAAEGYVAAKVVEDGDPTTCQREGSQSTVRVPRADVEKMNPPKFDQSEDMGDLPNLTEATVLHNIKDRYASDLIYTYSGLFCVVVNPYKRLPLYTDAVIEAYRGRKRAENPPHVFALTDQAYRDMLQDRQDQSILCTGESGAGKTENAKKVIQYLANIAAGGTHRKSGKEAEVEAAKRRRSTIGLAIKASASIEKGQLENQLLQANPILETFGNAATVKNDNSSRFGKFIRIHFDPSGFIVGASIDTYLLEKSRVVRQNKGERAFHCFYQLLKGANSALRAELFLEDITKYTFLSNRDSLVSLPNVDDAEEYERTNEAFKIMGMTPEEVKDVWRVVAAVLALGQLKFRPTRGQDQAELTTDVEMQKAAKLLGINVTDLTQRLIKPTIGAEQTVRQQTVEMVLANIESISKSTFEKLFLWIVVRINESLDRSRGRSSKNFIGILDIAGFEIFDVNSFEQLLINLTNEKLQQLFNQRMFILEQQEYVDQGIKWVMEDFGKDLQPTIDMIEQKMGLLELLETSTHFPRATDQHFCDSLEQHLGKAPSFVPLQEVRKLKRGGNFGIRHYADTVVYDATGWLIKNKDPNSEAVISLLRDSGNLFIKKLWTTDLNTVKIARAKQGAFRTVGLVYKEQLAQLMVTLNATVPNFVRCIIPNHEKRPGKLDGPLVLHQLRCNGVLEGIRIVRKGFPSRVLFAEFRQRYEILVPGAAGKGLVDGRVAVQRMVEALGLPEDDYRIGTTKVFFRTGVLTKLEETRDEKLARMLVGLQAYCRGKLARNAAKFLVGDHQAVEIIQRNVRIYLNIKDWPWWKLYCRVRPMLKDLTEQAQARGVKAQFEKLKAEYEASQTASKAMEAELQRLKADLQAKADELESANAQVDDAIGKLTSTKADYDELFVENQELDDRLKVTDDRVAELEDDLRTAKAEVTSLKEDLAKGSADQARITRLESEKAALIAKLEAAEAALKAAEEARKKLQAQVAELTTQLEAAKSEASKATKAKAKAEGELADVMHELSSERSRFAQADKASKKFAAEIAEEQRRTAAAAEEASARSAELRAAQTEVLKLKEELATISEDFAKSERERKQLRKDLEDAASKSDVERDMARLRAELRQAQQERDAAYAEREEVTTENIAVRRDLQAVQIELHALQSRAATTDTEGGEGETRKLQREMQRLQEEVEDHSKAKARLVAEKKKLEADVKSAHEMLDEEMAKSQKLDRHAKKLEQKLALAVDENRRLIESAGPSSAEVSKLRDKIAQIKKALEETEDEVAREKNGRRRAERDAEEKAENITALEKDVADLRAKLRAARVSAVSGGVEFTSASGTTTRTVHGDDFTATYTKTVRSKPKDKLDDDEVV